MSYSVQLKAQLEDGTTETALLTSFTDTKEHAEKDALSQAQQRIWKAQPVGFKAVTITKQD